MPYFKKISEGQSDRDRKIQVKRIPELLRVEGGALYPVCIYLTELFEVVSAEL